MTHLSQEPGEDSDHRAANHWYQRFEAERQAKPGQQWRHALLRWLLLLAAALLLVWGFALRGQRFRELGGEQSAGAASVEVDWTRRLRDELALDARTTALLMPRWRSWQQQELQLATEQSRLQEKLSTLSAERSDLNQSQLLILDSLRAVEGRRVKARWDLLDSCRQELGLWRAARLAGFLTR